MGRICPVKGVNETELVGMIRQFREKFADGMTTIPVTVEGPRGSEQVSSLGKLDLGLGKGQGFPMVALQGGFVVKGINLRRPSLHKEEDHPLGSLGETGGSDLALQKTGQGRKAQPHCTRTKERPSCEGFCQSLIHRR